MSIPAVHGEFQAAALLVLARERLHAPRPGRSRGSWRALRRSLAAAAGVDVPKLVEAKRISFANLLMAGPGSSRPA